MKDLSFIIYIIMGLLLVLVAILFARIYQYKRQMKLFAERISERLKQDMNQMVTVEYFDKDIIALANALNRYTSLMKEKNIELDSEKKKLKNVIAGISHDFRTPLTSAKGYLQMIGLSKELSAKNQEYLDIALEKTDYLRVLSDAFFDVSVTEAAEEIVKEDVYVTKLLSELAIDQYDWIKESGIKVEFHIPEKEIIRESNGTMLSRILNNFFSNARKYSKSYLNVSLTEKDNVIIIDFENDIEDGMDVDVEHIFDAFYRDNVRHKEGAGLGLYIVKRLCEKLGYQVQADIDKDKFHINLVIN